MALGHAPVSGSAEEHGMAREAAAAPGLERLLWLLRGGAAARRRAVRDGGAEAGAPRPACSTDGGAGAAAGHGGRCSTAAGAADGAPGRGAAPRPDRLHGGAAGWRSEGVSRFGGDE